MEIKTVLVTGGAGYIGSHSALELLNANYDVIVLDNFSNSIPDKDERPVSLNRIEKLTNKKITFYNVDILDKVGLEKIFKTHKVQCVIHFAAFKAVGESVRKPLDYYKNNVAGTIALLEVMQKWDVKNFVFSSSCTVYGNPQKLPLYENGHPTGQNLTNPYGRSKYFVEEILNDLRHADSNWNIVILRYFNPIGAHQSGLIGEDPKGIPNNLMPYVAQVCVGKLPYVRVYGIDYDTRDGTGVRDYAHVVDIAKGHVSALKKLSQCNVGCKVYNLGTGQGSTVLEMISAFEKATGKKIPYEIEGRRQGDVSSAYCDTSCAEKELGWKAKYNIEDMCRDLWKWQQAHPMGFRETN